MVKLVEEYWGRLTVRGAVLGLTAALALVPAAPAFSSDVKEVGVPSELPGAGPFIFSSAEEARVKVEIIARGLSHAYGLALLPAGDALIVERGVALRLLRGATGSDPQLIAQPIANIPSYLDAPHLHPDDVLGIQAVALDPDFATNRQVFFTYNKPVGFDPAAQRITAATILARGELHGLRLTKLKDLLEGEVAVGTGGSRILFGQNDDLFVSVGALSIGDTNSAQRTDNIYGKVLRISRNGAIPTDNPFVDTAGARPEIWTYGHRDPLGLAMDPRSARIVASEHGPQGGDELNEILPGRNYGWPRFTFGTEYGGSSLPVNPVGNGTEAPMMFWSPSIAPNGITFYTGDILPEWKNNLFVTSARRGQINGTGALIRVVFNDNLQEVRQEVLLDPLHQRFKDVRQGPDGLLYAVTDEENSVVLRIGPEG
ncbi:PQQ-dependent sugar dehydrogenase [Parasphingorhabdus sp.]|uniref:PQQ-dependent sugar dehydrogenase n=1 Tax=Parasphingorhabdus sp. TaxID=2709688 RepID=UPI003A918B60